MTKTRKAAGLTQQTLALRLKKPQSFVAKYEGGERRLDVVEFIAIAHALGADPIKLIATLLDSGKKKSSGGSKKSKRGV
jgi:transcriptional regulator with XRE-family HTH domain